MAVDPSLFVGLVVRPNLINRLPGKLLCARRVGTRQQQRCAIPYASERDPSASSHTASAASISREISANRICAAIICAVRSPAYNSDLRDLFLAARALRSAAQSPLLHLSRACAKAPWPPGPARGPAPPPAVSALHCGPRARTLLHQRAVVVQISLKRSHRSIRNQKQSIGNEIREVRIARDQHHRATRLTSERQPQRQRKRQRTAQ